MNEKAKARAPLEASVVVDPIHEFTLILDADELTGEMADRLYTSGCDDATICRQGGETMIRFSRDSSSYADAVASAIGDVNKAGYRVARIATDDLLSQADIARKIGRSRQAINMYIAGTRGQGGFPPAEARTSGEHSLWRWSKVAAWLKLNGLASGRVAEEAAVDEAVNIILKYEENRRSEPTLFESLSAKMFGAKPTRVAKSRRPKTAHRSRQTAAKKDLQTA